MTKISDVVALKKIKMDKDVNPYLLTFSFLVTVSLP